MKIEAWENGVLIPDEQVFNVKRLHREGCIRKGGTNPAPITQKPDIKPNGQTLYITSL